MAVDGAEGCDIECETASAAFADSPAMDTCNTGAPAAADSKGEYVAAFAAGGPEDACTGVLVPQPPVADRGVDEEGVDEEPVNIC